MVHIVSEMKKVLRVPISMHCHNNIGLAVANTLTGVKAGVKIFQVTVNGIGKRTSNVALEKMEFNLFVNYGVETVYMTKLGPTFKLMDRITRFPITYNKPVVGRNAFAHESGIHVHGVMANSIIYEPFKSEMVGVKRHIVIRKHSKEYFVRNRLEELNVKFSEEHMPELIATIKKMAVDRKDINDVEPVAIAENVLWKREAKKQTVSLKRYRRVHWQGHNLYHHRKHHFGRIEESIV